MIRSPSPLGCGKSVPWQVLGPPVSPLLGVFAAQPGPSRLLQLLCVYMGFTLYLCIFVHLVFFHSSADVQEKMIQANQLVMETGISSF